MPPRPAVPRRLEIVVPARDEARRLPAMLAALGPVADTMARSGDVLEIVVVDNGSRDGTAEVARRHDRPGLPVRVVSAPAKGKGVALRVGFAATTAPFVGFLDADGATDPVVVLTALGLLTDGVDVVVGSRSLAQSRVQARHSRVRDLGARAFRASTARIAPVGGDTQCGAKFFAGDLARAVFAVCRTDGFCVDVEVLARAARAGARTVEVPVDWTDVPGSTFVPARHGLTSFLSLGAVAWRVRDGRPAVVAPVTTVVVAEPVPGASPAVSGAPAGG